MRQQIESANGRAHGPEQRKWRDIECRTECSDHWADIFIDVLAITRTRACSSQLANLYDNGQTITITTSAIAVVIAL